MEDAQSDREARLKKRNNTTDATASKMEERFKEIKDQLEQINKKLNKAENRDKETRKKFLKIDEVLSEISEMKSLINKIMAENQTLKNKIKTLENDNKSQRLQRIKDEIEIHGIAPEMNENVTEITKDLLVSVNLPINKGDIKECFRPISKDNRIKPIRVKLTSIDMKNKIVKRMKEAKPRLANLGKSPENKKMYVNEAQLPETKRLLYKVKEVIKSKSWNKAWIYAHNVFLLMEENGNQIKIENEEDLENLLKE